ncbi:MAG: hypothetical protein ABIR33_08345 [Pyrinomonadaceae bacterium]
MSRTPEDLSFVQAVRKRPAMYLGSTTIRGVYLLLRQFVRYAVTVANSDNFTFEILDGRSGRISLHVPDGPMDESVFTDPPYGEWSGRSVDYELAALNAICSTFHVRQKNLETGDIREVRFAQGYKAVVSSQALKAGLTTVEIEFKIDESIVSPDESFDWNPLLEVFRTLAYLYAGKSLRVIYETNGDAGEAIFRFEHGLADLVDLQRLYEHAEPQFATTIEHDFDEFSIDLALYFRGNSVDMPYLISFVNEERSMEDGTHVEGVLKGVLAALIHFQKESADSVDGTMTIGGLSRLLVAAVHLRMDRPMYEGAIKGKVVSRNIVGPISNHVGEAMLTRLRTEPERAIDLVKMVVRLSK